MLFLEITKEMHDFDARNIHYYNIKRELLPKSDFFNGKVSSCHFFCVTLYANSASNKTKNYINMKKYLGILLIVIGAIVLLISYLTELVDYNPVQFSGLGLIIAGLIAHIIITRRTR